MCDRIVKYIEDPVGAKQFETPSTSMTDGTVNKVRLINVFFGEAIKPKLHERARNLTKDEMTVGFKNGQPCWEDVMKEYNDKTKYNDIEHEHIGLAPAAHPHLFSPISSWVNYKETYHSMWKDYERYFGNWKKSGTHEEMGEIIVDKAFACVKKAPKYFRNSISCR
jgi:hypothetical protein